jgi:exodeoxyribonuclease V beta subunit
VSGPTELRTTEDIRRLFDLDSHGVIEASAGTGKTYTMVEIALRILEEGRARLGEILMITFTEKAAGELRSRIRARIEKALDEGPADPVRLRLLEALEGFDEARISTIHAFCMRLLEEHAFESGQPFASNQADEGELLVDLLRERQRKQWSALDQGQLGDALRLAGYPHPSKRTGESQWERTVLEIAGHYTPEAGDRLEPPPLAEPVDRESMGRVAAELRTLLCECAPLLDLEADRDPGVDPPLVQMMRRDKVAANTVRALCEQYVVPLTNLIETADGIGDGALFEAAQLFLTASTRSEAFRKSGHDHFHTRMASRGSPELLDRARGIAERVARMDAVLASYSPEHQLAANTVDELHEDLVTWTRARGILTYGGMIRGVHAAVTAEGGASAFVDQLRAQFRYAIVDEFQDTDRLQWEILRTVFADAGPPWLFIVGDPKQSIYGFRGADIHAYEAARDALVASRGAPRYVLPVNRRASGDLVEACNRLFGEGGWFGERAVDPVDRGTVEAPPTEEQRYRIVRDTSGRDPVTFVRLPKGTPARQSRALWAQFLAGEIRALIPPDGPAALTLRAGEVDRPLDYSDVCVLVERRSEAEFAIQALRSRRIPCSFYKQTGLWRSEEAMHLHYLLQALAEPEDPSAWRTALLTRFLRVPPERVAELAEAPPEHPLSVLLWRWVRWAERRQWPRLFQSILSEGPVLLEDLERAPEEWERRLTNYRHLMQLLEQYAIRAGADIHGLVEYLATRRATGAGEQPDEDLYRIETEEPRVQVMTIHAAKGLEFPVVFLAGGFTSGPTSSYARRYDPASGGHWVFDLSGRSSTEDEERNATRRLYYVAVTRAALRVYIPLVEQKTKPGALTTLILPTATRAWGEEGLAAAALDELDLGEAPSRRPAPPPAPEPARMPGAGSGKPRLPRVVRPEEVRRLVPFASFTGLHGAAAATSYGESLPRLDDDPGGLDPAPTAIPGGAATGQFFHEALERLLRTEDLEAALSDGSLRALMLGEPARALPARSLTPEFLAESATLLRRALRTPLPVMGCSVADLAPSGVLPEVEFLYPLSLGAGPSQPVEEIRRDGSFLTGVIDVVARVGERHYLIDWKTNRLDRYDQEALAACMAHQEYDLQYAIYALALERWLRSAYGEAYAPDRHLGGVCYVFLRGLSDEPDSPGLHSRQLDAEALAEFEVAVRRRLGGSEVSRPDGEE